MPLRRSNIFRQLLLCYTVLVVCVPAYSQSPAPVTTSRTRGVPTSSDPRVGFYHPTGKPPEQHRATSCGYWLASTPDDLDSCYRFTTSYHIGHDIMGAEGDPIYAMTNGVVERISTSGWDVGVGLLIKHTLDDGTEFIAVYGHIHKRTDVVEGKAVSGGELIGTVAHNPGGDHLHFGIRRGTSTLQPVATIPDSEYRNDDGSINTADFVDPLDWLRNYEPRCGNATSERYLPNGQTPLHPQGSLVRTRNDATVYVLINNQRRAIQTRDRLNNLYYGEGYAPASRGFDFRDVIIISDAEMARYPKGPVVDAPLPRSNSREPDGRLIRQRHTSEIAIVSGGKRRPFPSYEMFIRMGYLECNVAIVDDYIYYAEGAPVTPFVEISAGGGGGGIEVDLTPPEITLTGPGDGAQTASSEITLTGTATDAGRGASGVSRVTVAGVESPSAVVTGDATAYWSRVVPLAIGANYVTISARDGSPNGNESARTITVNRVNSSSPENTAPDFTSATTTSASARSVALGQSVTFTLNVTNRGASAVDRIADFEIYDAGGTRVHQSFERTTQGAGSTITRAIDWTPSSAGEYKAKVGIFSPDWSTTYHWNDQAARVTVSGNQSPPPPAPAAGVIDVWWPTDNSTLSGTQPLRALLQGRALADYVMYWQVDGGVLNLMGDSLVDYPHKDTSIDFSGWTWRGANPYGPYQLTFTAKDSQGSVLATRSVTIYVATP